MTTTRRHFLAASSAAALTALAAGAPVRAAAGRTGLPRRTAPMKILILGGTGFLGPACIDAAKARGHTVTIFNRGRTEKRTGHAYEGTDVEVLRGNRDPQKHAEETKDESGKIVQVETSPKGLSQLEGRSWDAVIDTSGYYPRIVEASAELLAPRVNQYVFISSVSVYKDQSRPGGQPTDPVGTLTDPTVETMGASFENYGPLKAYCEQAAEAAFPGRATNVRPGLIVGPGDPTGRFTYWPARLDRGGEVLAPGTPADQVQVIDVRDLAEWLVRLIETRTYGVFDALGPQSGLTIGGMLEACRAAAGKEATLTWVDAPFLEAQNVTPWGDMPVWIPPSSSEGGMHQRNISTAERAGLTFRPIPDTCRATLEWYRALPAESPFRKLAGIDPEREAAVLRAWHARGG